MAKLDPPGGSTDTDDGLEDSELVVDENLEIDEDIDAGTTDDGGDEPPKTEVLKVKDKKKSTKKADKKAKEALKAEKKEGKKKMEPATGAMIVLAVFFVVGLIAGHVFFGHPYAITLIAFGFMFMGAAGLVMAILKLFVIPAVEAVVEDIKKT